MRSLSATSNHGGCLTSYALTPNSVLPMCRLGPGLGRLTMSAGAGTRSFRTEQAQHTSLCPVCIASPTCISIAFHSRLLCRSALYTSDTAQSSTTHPRLSNAGLWNKVDELGGEGQTPSSLARTGSKDGLWIPNPLATPEGHHHHHTENTPSPPDSIGWSPFANFNAQDTASTASTSGGHASRSFIAQESTSATSTTLTADHNTMWSFNAMYHNTEDDPPSAPPTPSQVTPWNPNTTDDSEQGPPSTAFYNLEDSAPGTASYRSDDSTPVSASPGSDDTSWYSIARDVELKMDIMTTSPYEMVEMLLNPSIRMFPETTSSVLLKFVVWTTDGTLAKSGVSQESLHAVVEVMERQVLLDIFSADAGVMSNILWSLATLRKSSMADRWITAPEDESRPAGTATAAGPCLWPSNQALNEGVAEWGRRMMEKTYQDTPGGLALCGTKELASLMWSYCLLLAVEPGSDAMATSASQSDNASLPVRTAGVEFVDCLAEYMTTKLHSPHIHVFQPIDFADIGWGLAALGRRSKAVVALWESMAREVTRQMRKQKGFAPSGLLMGQLKPTDELRLLRSYADLAVTADSAQQMFECISERVAARINACSMYAPARPSELLCLLTAMADSGHSNLANSEVFMPAITKQLLQLIASYNESLMDTFKFVPMLPSDSSVQAGIAASSAPGPASYGQQAPGPAILNPWQQRDLGTSLAPMSDSWRSFMPPSVAVQLLKVYCRLGHKPRSDTVTSLLVASFHQLGNESPESVTLWCEMLAELSHHPGEGVLHVLLTSVRQKLDSYSSVQLLRVLHSCTALGMEAPDDLMNALMSSNLLSPNRAASQQLHDLEVIKAKRGEQQVMIGKLDKQLLHRLSNDASLDRRDANLDWKDANLGRQLQLRVSHDAKLDGMRGGVGQGRDAQRNLQLSLRMDSTAQLREQRGQQQQASSPGATVQSSTTQQQQQQQQEQQQASSPWATAQSSTTQQQQQQQEQEQQQASSPGATAQCSTSQQDEQKQKQKQRQQQKQQQQEQQQLSPPLAPLARGVSRMLKLRMRLKQFINWLEAPLKPLIKRQDGQQGRELGLRLTIVGNSSNSSSSTSATNTDTASTTTTTTTTSSTSATNTETASTTTSSTTTTTTNLDVSNNNSNQPSRGTSKTTTTSTANLYSLDASGVGRLLFVLTLSGRLSADFFEEASLYVHELLKGDGDRFPEEEQVMDRQQVLLMVAGASAVLGAEGRAVLERTWKEHVLEVQGALHRYLGVWSDQLSTYTASHSQQLRKIVDKMGFMPNLLYYPVEVAPLGLELQGAVSLSMPATADMGVGADRPEYIVFDVCAGDQVSSNKGEAVLGEAAFRHTILRSLAGICSVPVSSVMLEELDAEEAGHYVAQALEQKGLKAAC